MKAYTHCAKIQTTESKVIYKRLNITYNTGLKPALGWELGKGWLSSGDYVHNLWWAGKVSV